MTIYKKIDERRIHIFSNQSAFIDGLIPPYKHFISSLYIADVLGVGWNSPWSAWYSLRGGEMERSFRQRLYENFKWMPIIRRLYESHVLRSVNLQYRMVEHIDESWALGTLMGLAYDPIIGEDGAVLAVDLIEGGFGYQYPPIVEVKNGCNIGDGSIFESILSDDGYTINTLKYYSECPGIESNLELCDENPVEKAGWGRMFNQEGVDIGPWDPTKYTDNILADPIDLELEAYEKALAEFKNPFWTSRSNTPVTITSDDKVTTKKYDVYNWAWGANPGINPKGESFSRFFSAGT